jgi:hypothetical protein
MALTIKDVPEPLRRTFGFGDHFDAGVARMIIRIFYGAGKSFYASATQYCVH